MANDTPANPTTVMIPGTPDTAAAPPTKKLFKDEVKVLSAFNIKPPSRDGGPAEFVTLDAKQLAGKVVELEFENGQKLWVSGERLTQKLAADKQTAKSRGLATGEPDSQVRLPHAFALPGRTRGIVGQAILKGLKIIGFDPALEIAKGAAQLAVRHIEDQLVAGTIEKSLAQLNDGGVDRSGWLFPFDDKVQLAVDKQIKDAKTIAGAEPYLVFIHGTASSSNGSFGKLANTEEWKQLRADYGQRILAFEHRSLSVSPIKNALDLLEVIPEGATLHLVSHSRGGLVGELLCLSQVARAQVQLEELLQVYEKTKAGDGDAQAARSNERELLSKLWEVSAAKRLKIERFVRVACPARGTTWLANNLDYFFSALLHAIELVPGLSENPIYDFIKATMTALVKLRANPAELPGLEAMMPSSPLISFLNQPGLTTAADLAVIAGDGAVGGSLSSSLLTLLSNAVLWEKNDWVVNTRAMDGGLKRQQQAWRFFDEGNDVNHFSYFFNADSRRRLAMRLALKAQPFEQTKGFDKLTQRGAEKIDVAAARSGPVNREGKPAEAKGTVFVLPGIMGSELKYQGKEVWLNHLALLRGDMSKLAVEHLAPEVLPEGLIASDYKRLVVELSRSYRVIPFAYDWRQSVKEAGENLVRAVRGALADSNDKPIHLVAHSMGGLVARSMIAHDGELWQELTKRQGRLIMLGTPNHGAHQIARMLLGEEKLLKMLALLDFKHDITELLQILRAYPGVLDLLPEEYFNATAWNKLNEPLAENKRFPLPDTTALGKAREWRKRLKDDAAGPAQMIYVAGFAERTPLDLGRAADGVLEVTETTQGDGRVTYKLGKLDNVPTYYADVVHGDMADHPPLFPAITDLLAQGRTDRLRQQPRLDRAGAATTIVTRAEEIEPVFPTEEELQDAISGGRSRLITGTADSAYTVQVSVMHGHLRYAKYPVAVGHYTGTPIVNAEAVLDKRLNGRLSERHKLNRYPGPQNTAAVVLMGPDHQPPGALIVGLGEIGEIRADVVRQGVTTAALEYALALAECPARASESGVRSAAFSTLMIGTYGGHALTVDESVEAILTGVVNANRILQAQKLWDKVRIDKVELVELYEDVAIQAIHAAHRLRMKPPAEFGDQVGIEVAPNLLNAQRGGRYQRPFTPYANDWWRRIQIVGVNKQSSTAIYQSFPELLRQLRAAPAARETLRGLIEKVMEESARVPTQRAYLIELINCLHEFEQAARKAEDDSLEFTVLTDRARAEGLMQATQRLWVDRLVRDSIAQPVFNASLATTLFELLVPNELKSQSENTLLVLDREAARYPWELLAERSQKDKPVVTQIGLLRQFKTVDFRPNPIPARERNALVVGDAADHGLPELFGAQQEAQLVAAALKPAQFEVQEMIKPNGADVITELFAREYQILHIAAHGIFDPNESKRQGIVLGREQYLTSIEIANLRAVPELVFINCCHLGQLDAQAQSDQRRLSTEYPHRLAASVAEELIKIGVKAVVAAGWAVDDEAALTFAEEFYREMLGGTRFGEAVLAARQRTFQLHSQTNTWGAYQCYGNPSFTLNTGYNRGDSDGNFYSRREYRDELKSIAEQPDAADPLNNGRWVEALERVQQALPDNLRDGEMLTDLGDAWRDLGDFTKAIDAYKLAVAQADARASLRVVERLANLESRRVDSELRKAEAANGDLEPELVKEAGPGLKKAIAQLTWLNEAFGETPERLSLLGRVYKSQALLAAWQQQDYEKPLQQASKWYAAASERSIAGGQPRDNYSTFNWLACRILLGEYAPAPPNRKSSRARKTATPPVQPEFLRLLEDCVSAARQKLAVKEEFWVRVAIPDALVWRYLYLGNLSERDNKEQVIAEYQATFGTGARPHEVDSALSQLDFMRMMLARQQAQASVVEALGEIKARLLTGVQTVNG